MIGTGTGRTLDLFSDRFARALCIDVNQAMLPSAPAKLKTDGCTPAPVRPAGI